MAPLQRYGTAVPVVNQRRPGGEAAEAGGEEAAAVERRLRRDARENHGRILAAAEAVFAEQGVGAPIGEVAARAGLGVGTLYRHFSSKEALFAAICEQRVEGLLAEAATAAAADAPGEALFSLLEHLGSLAEDKRDFLDALRAAGLDAEVQIQHAGEQLLAHLRRLVERAQAAGDVRSDLGAEELCGLIAATCTASEHVGRASRERMLAVVFDGLRPRP